MGLGEIGSSQRSLSKGFMTKCSHAQLLLTFQGNENNVQVAHYHIRGAGTWGGEGTHPLLWGRPVGQHSHVYSLFLVCSETQPRGLGLGTRSGCLLPWLRDDPVWSPLSAPHILGL